MENEHETTDGLNRQIQIKFRVTEAERDLIYEKMRLFGTNNLAAYLRKIAIDGYVINTDNSDLKAIAAEMQKIGVNINQIARRVNSSSRIYGHGRGVKSPYALRRPFWCSRGSRRHIGFGSSQPHGKRRRQPPTALSLG